MFRKEGGTEYFLLGKARYWFAYIMFVDNDFCSKLRPYVYRLNLSCLYLGRTNISLNDIDFLLANNQIKYLVLSHVNIRDADGNAIPFNHVLGKVPSVEAFTYKPNSEIYSNQTWEKLNSIKLFNKLLYVSMDIQQTSEELDPKIIGKFFENNMSSLGKVKLSFPPDAPEIEPMKAKLKQIADNWMPRRAAPKFTVNTFLIS